MTTDLDVIQDADIVERDSGTLFRTDDPVEIIARATGVADALKQVIVSQQLATKISGREFVRVEGWTTLGALLGVFPVTVWTKPLPDGWEARVEARTKHGEVIGAAEASCLRSERNWKDRDDYAIRSMAQTRATSKAMRQPLGWIIVLAGYDATPAEEMIGIKDLDPDPVETDFRCPDCGAPVIDQSALVIKLKAQDPKRKTPPAFKCSNDPEACQGPGKKYARGWFDPDSPPWDQPNVQVESPWHDAVRSLVEGFFKRRKDGTEKIAATWDWLVKGSDPKALPKDQAAEMVDRFLAAVQAKEGDEKAEKLASAWAEIEQGMATVQPTLDPERPF